MALVARSVGAAGPHGPLLLPTTLTAEAGQVTIVAGDPGPSSTALALVLGGRLPHDEGTVLLGHDETQRYRRHHVVLVDVPDITEPEPGLPLDVVVGEELALAGLPSSRKDIDAFLREHDATDRASVRWEMLSPAERVGLLGDIVPRRDGTQAVVLASPDRHGGSPRDWFGTATRLADQGLIVVVLCTHASARLLGLADTFEVGVA